jgi:hypothetical protein
MSAEPHRPPWTAPFDVERWAVHLARYGASVPPVPIARFALLTACQRAEVVAELVEDGASATAEVMIDWHRRPRWSARSVTPVR